jgi:hypothetical protein
MESNIDINTGGGAVIGSAIGGSSNTVNNQNIEFNQYAYEQKQNLAEAAAEIQQLLQQLELSYPVNTTSEQMIVAAEAIKKIETNPSLKQRVIAALKEGGIQAFEKAIDHPLGAFVVGAIKGWQEAK